MELIIFDIIGCTQPRNLPQLLLAEHHLIPPHIIAVYFVFGVHFWVSSTLIPFLHYPADDTHISFVAAMRAFARPGVDVTAHGYPTVR